MEQVMKILPITPMKKDLSNDDFERIRVGWMNSEHGTLNLIDGIECDRCLNRGRIYIIDEDGYFSSVSCKCMNHRLTKRLMVESGLGRLIEKCTFESYRTDEPWQESSKTIAEKYANNHEGWLFVSGQSGSGKTHICTAVCNELMKSGYSVMYKIWSDLFHEIDSTKYNYGERQRIFNDLIKADFLYIDDFFKGYRTKDDRLESGYSIKEKDMPLIALDVINSRYNAGKPLILSTELILGEIESIGEALAGRIDEMSKGQKIQIKKEKERNLRRH